MPLYHVHLYREMKLLYSHIEADTPGQAAAIARARRTEDAVAVADALRERIPGAKRIGTVDNTAAAPGLPHAHFLQFADALPDAEFVPAAREYEDLRLVPSDEELEWFRKGSALNLFHKG